MPLTKLDIEYYEWLVEQIDIPNKKLYDDLFNHMHNVEFVWTVPNDDNRIHDGMLMRVEFFNGKSPVLSLEGVTFLEVLIGLSRRAAFVAGGNPEEWAWRLIKNLQLNKMSDDSYVEDTVTDILHSVIWRTYQENGKGGFFPLKNPELNQTQVEVWYQLNAYVGERAGH